MNQLVPVNAAAGFTVSEVERVALAIAKGGLFGSKDPNAVLTLCLLAQAEGQHPAVVFRDYHIISGKPAKKAEAMLRDFISSGGKVKWHELSDTCADATFTHPSGEARIEWTLERAKKAGISTAMWSKYPRQMLRSRVISEGVRTVYPGATSGLYVPEEVSGFDDPPHDAATGEIIDAAPAHARSGPAPRTVLDGPHTSKTALRNAVCEVISKVRAAQSLEEIETIKTENKRTINQARRDWPELIDGEPDIEEDIGLKGAIELRRQTLGSEENAVVSCLIESMKQCETSLSLTNWRAANEEMVDSLDGADGRKFELAWDLHESAVQEMEKVHN